MSGQLFDLTGRLALVTGSSRGIGHGLARGLAAAGARVIVNGRDGDRLNEAAAALCADGADVFARPFDVTDEGAVEAAVAEIESDVGPIDILVNNAGVHGSVSLEDLSVDDWHRVLNGNLTGAFVVGRAVARRMIPRGRGKIVNICSLMSEVARPTIAAYTTSKGGLKALTKAMCVDWARHNIQANGIGPGYYATEMTRALRGEPDFDAWVRRRTPAGRWGKVDDLVGAAVFLAAPASDFVNGQILYVDGGLLAAI